MDGSCGFARCRQVGRHHCGRGRSAEGREDTAACAVRDEGRRGVQERGEVNERDAGRSEYKVRAGYPRPDCAAEWKRHKRNLWIYLAMIPGWMLYGFLVLKL